MRDLKVYVEKAMKELDSINVPYSKYVTDWKINDRAKKRWGQCTKLEKKIGNEPTFEIQISKTLLEENNDESGLLTVIIHELLHTCKGGMTHKGKWKYYADIVTSKLGYTLTRTNSKEELGISEIPKELQSMPKSVNFRFKCKRCGIIIERHNRSKFVKNYTHYICTACGGKFEKLTKISLC